MYGNVRGFIITAFDPGGHIFYWRFHGRNKKIKNNKQADKTKQKQKQNRGSKKYLRQQNSPSLNLSPKVERRGKECQQNYAQFEELRKKSNSQTMPG